MSDQMIFKRHEIKYLITTEQLALILEEFQKHMVEDEHGESTICSLYFDTPSFQLIRRSLEHPTYKEKLRLRSYDVANDDTKVFVELKKKYKQVVYKRRITLKKKDAMRYLLRGEIDIRTQITDEIDYFKEFYSGIAPSMLLMYKRNAYYSREDRDFRVTFDRDILWRDYDLSLDKGIYGQPILEPNHILMEVKTKDAIPLWMTKILTDNHIYKKSFSKYGTAYQTKLRDQLQKGKLNYA